MKLLKREEYIKTTKTFEISEHIHYVVESINGRSSQDLKIYNNPYRLHLSPDIVKDEFFELVKKHNPYTESRLFEDMFIERSEIEDKPELINNIVFFCNEGMLFDKDLNIIPIPLNSII